MDRCRSRLARAHHPLAAVVLVAIGCLAATQAAAAVRELRVPLRFDTDFVREAIAAQVYTSASGKAVPWDDGTGCNFLKLREPSVTMSGSRVRITSRGEGRIGTAIGGSCIAPVQWEGYLEIFEEPSISEDQKTLRFQVVESNLYDTKWKKPLITGRLWDLVKSNVHSSFEAVRIDLRTATDDLRQLLPDVLVHDDLARVNRIVDSLRLASATVIDNAVAVTMLLDIEPAPPTLPAPEPTFSAQELERWQAAWQRWDGFLTYIVKFMWNDTLVSDLRQPLADVLLDARYDILEALAPTPGTPDPVPDLFVKTWQRLVPVARQIASKKPGANAVRYFSFIAAGDALVALQEAGPDVGVDISADGLRRLARIVAPASGDDVTAYDEGVDAQLRTLLGFGAPLPPPDLSGVPSDDESWWRTWLRPKPAWAAGEAPGTETLRRWIAAPEALDVYLPAVREVLDKVTIQTLETSALADAYHEVFRRMVLATAWQESCWRQFVLQSGQITYLKSGVGASGMMQVNEKVWRGVYDLKGLRWDIKYNGRAGAEITMHYLSDYAVAKKEHQQPGGIDNLARATYAIYNGGPGQIARYRKPNTKPSLKKIDALFWEKYDAVSKGRTMDVAKCYGG